MLPSKRIEKLTGMRFGKLTVLNYYGQTKEKRSIWVCRCDCGVRLNVEARYLKAGTQTCGSRFCKISKNKYEVHGDIAIGYTTDNRRFTIDAEDLSKVSCFSWSINSNGYLVATYNNKRIYIHKIILPVKKGLQIDHIDLDKLDNRKSNLRICEANENSRNKKKTDKATTSKYKGVHMHTQMKKYCAQIRCGENRYHLGVYENEVDAAKAYDNAAKKYHGEFARLNGV